MPMPAGAPDTTEHSGRLEHVVGRTAGRASVLKRTDSRPLFTEWCARERVDRPSAPYRTCDSPQGRGGVTRLTVTHDVTGAPEFTAMFAGEGESTGAGGGWSEVLSGLKTLLETGVRLPFQSGPQKESSACTRRSNLQ